MKHRTVVSLAVPLLAVVACVDAPQPEDVPTHLIAAVDRPSGNRVEFQATEDGAIVMSESGPAGNLPTLPPAVAVGVDPVAYYRALTDGAEAPAELLELAAQRPAPAAAAAPLVLLDGPRPIAGSSGSTWFQGAACDKYGSSDLQWCLLDKTGDSKRSHSDVNGVYAVVYVEKGELDLDARTRPWYTWSTSTWTIQAGSWRSWWHSKATDFDFQSRIRGAAGDTYDHAGMACWDGLGDCPVFTPLK